MTSARDIIWRCGVPAAHWITDTTVRVSRAPCQPASARWDTVPAQTLVTIIRPSHAYVYVPASVLGVVRRPILAMSYLVGTITDLYQLLYILSFPFLSSFFLLILSLLLRYTVNLKKCKGTNTKYSFYAVCGPAILLLLFFLNTPGSKDPGG